MDLLLEPLLEFVEGDESPPLAPKHVTAATARPRKSREPRIRKKPKFLGDDLSDVETSSTRQSSSPRLAELKHEEVPKRTRTPKPAAKSQHLEASTDNHKKMELIDKNEYDDTTEGDVEELEIEPMDYEYNDKTYAQRLLQFFMSNKSTIPSILNKPPRDMDINVIIDDEGHTSLHWAAAMGHIKIVKVLVNNGADIYRVNYKGQTALMRSVLFTNNFDLNTFDALADILRTTIFNIDKKDQTVFHHTAAMSDWKGKIYASRYYMECLISKFKNNQSELISILNVQDVNGDTALTIAAKTGNRRILKLLIDAGASADIVNEEGMAPKDYLTDIEKSMIARSSFSSSPPLISSPSDSGALSSTNEADTRDRLRARIQAMFKNVTADPNCTPPISEIFDEFADSYERDLIHKERLLDRKKVELDLSRKRLEETKKALNSIDFHKEIEKTRACIVEAEEKGASLESQYTKWFAYSQKQRLQLLEDRLYYDDGKPPSPPLQAYSTDELEKTAERLREELIQLEDLRKKHVHQLITLRSSIPSKKCQDYKRLISTSCNVPYENVDMMLVPLLASFDAENTQENK